MRKTFLVMAALLLVLGLAGIAGAGLTNPGFETGDFTGWTVYDAAHTAVVTNAQTTDGTTFTAPEGNHFAVAEVGLGDHVPTTISQTAFFNAGETFVGKALFDGNDSMPFNDYAFVNINSITYWSSNIGAVGDLGHTPWQQWTFTAPSAGNYLFTYGVANSSDNVGPSRAFFDGNNGSPVPIPGAVWLLGSGLVGLAGLRRKFNL